MEIIKTQKFVVIFSDKYDYSTLKVAEYLQFWGEKVIRVNPEDTFQCTFNVAITNKNYTGIEIQVNGISLHLKNIKSIWFRRPGLTCRGIDKNEILKDADILHPIINQYLLSEQHALNQFLYRSFIQSKIKVLGNPFLFNINKLSVLNKAILHGLDIPYTLISTNGTQVGSLLNQKGSLITKAIQDNFTPILKGEGYGLATETIDETILSNLPSSFFPSLFQERIDKKFDVRIFYLDETFYSVAILSQENEKTATDFRNYDDGNPNRKNIFNLPSKIKGRLMALLKDLELNTASIDMVYTKGNRYVFLEINPVGQYDMVGKPMNFQLDKKIAIWLANK